MAEPDVPQNWIIAGERPSLTGAKRQEIQDLLQKRVLVTSDIATQLETLSGFYVAGYMPRSATANSIAESRFPLGGQLAILSLAVCTVVGYSIDHPASAARLSIPARAFEKGIGVIREHALDYFQTMMVPANRNRLVKLINSDLTDWSSELFQAGVIAGSNWLEPSSVGQLPAVVVPIWTRLDAFLNSGGLMHVEEQAAKRPAKQRKMEDKTVRVCFSWASKQSCHFAAPAFSRTMEPANRGGGLARGRALGKQGGRRKARLPRGKRRRGRKEGERQRAQRRETGNRGAGPACGRGRPREQGRSSSCRGRSQGQT